jgi:hypothetical protein
LEFARFFTPWVVLLDVTLPGMGALRSRVV